MLHKSLLQLWTGANSCDSLGVISKQSITAAIGSRAVMEHRWGERVMVDIPVQVSVPPLVIGTGRITNISISGAWISGRFDLPTLARAFVVFDFSLGGLREALPIACFVARVRAQGMGVEWRELAPQIVSDLMLFAAGTNHALEQGSVAPALADTAADAPAVPITFQVG
jgi:hypothetical protein